MALAESASAQFRQRFGRRPTCRVAAPGRVNLIGEHTDYNDGFVLPMAIDRYVVIAAAARVDRQGDGDPTATLYSIDLDASAKIQIVGKMAPGPVTWSNYPQGVVAGFVKRGFAVPPFEAVIQSNLPLGGGLSSSAALEVATATLLETLLEHSLDRVEKAQLCREAEHEFAGVPCGIMDQFSSIFGERDALLLLDCRSHALELVPMTDPNVTVLIANSNVRHELSDGEYAVRRTQCEEAASTLGATSLRDVSLATLDGARDRLDDVIVHRARHVITEIDRTVKAAEAIRRGKWDEVGQLMYASHKSLRDDYEVSCEELDFLVELADKLGSRAGVIGSRMTGGGFGGCTVNLVRTNQAASVGQSLQKSYLQQTGIEPTLFTTRPAKGARAILP